ncbi:MAG: acetolactate synthase small subunit [Lentisphaeria bacterium]
MEQTKTNAISLLVRNKFGALTRIAALFSGRGYNIDSLTVATISNDDATSKMTIVTHGDQSTLEQIEKQLAKLVDVIAVTVLDGQEFISRELMLIKVNCTSENRSDVLQLSQIYNAKVANVHHNSIALEVVGLSDKIDSFITLMEKYGIIEIVRSGPIGMLRSDQSAEQKINL